MSSSPDAPDSPRQTCLPVILSLVSVGFFAWLLIVATGGWALYLLLVVGALALFALFHYVLWGGLLSQQIIRQREEEERRLEQEGDWRLPEADRHGQFRE
jgi:hypothetical protein